MLAILIGLLDRLATQPAPEHNEKNLIRFSGRVMKVRTDIDRMHASVQLYTTSFGRGEHVDIQIKRSLANKLTPRQKIFISGWPGVITFKDGGRTAGIIARSAMIMTK